MPRIWRIAPLQPADSVRLKGFFPLPGKVRLRSSAKGLLMKPAVSSRCWFWLPAAWWIPSSDGKVSLLPPKAALRRSGANLSVSYGTRQSEAVRQKSSSTSRRAAASAQPR